MLHHVEIPEVLSNDLALACDLRKCCEEVGSQVVGKYYCGAVLSLVLEVSTRSGVVQFIQ